MRDGDEGRRPSSHEIPHWETGRPYILHSKGCEVKVRCAICGMRYASRGAGARGTADIPRQDPFSKTTTMVGKVCKSFPPSYTRYVLGILGRCRDGSPGDSGLVPNIAQTRFISVYVSCYGILNQFI